jgi:hypothetical protein
MLATINQTEASLTSSGTVARNDDDCLSYKFKQLQSSALFAQMKLKTIPGTATVEDRGAEVISALYPVDRWAFLISLMQPETNAGAKIKARAVEWLDRGNFNSLSELVRGAA